MSPNFSHQQCIMLHVDCEDADGRMVCPVGKVARAAEVTGCPLLVSQSLWMTRQDVDKIFGDVKLSLGVDNRTRLLLSGAYLEEQITLCALEALAIGFDVHLLYDQIKARTARLEPVHKLMLFQAGAVPSSLQQILYMWHATERQQGVAKDLQDILAQF